ncbi:MAG: hypothetical protein ACJAR2_001896 [Ilumatobacter sp.]|jgi:hypothetical protein
MDLRNALAPGYSPQPDARQSIKYDVSDGSRNVFLGLLPTLLTQPSVLSIRLATINWDSLLDVLTHRSTPKHKSL